METETLSNYEQSQDKHILGDPINVNIPNHDEDSNSLPANVVNDADSDGSTGPPGSLNKKGLNDTLNKSTKDPNILSVNHEEKKEKSILCDQENILINASKPDLPNEKQNEEEVLPNEKKGDNVPDEKGETENEENKKKEEAVDATTKLNKNKIESTVDSMNRDGCENKINSVNEKTDPITEGTVTNATIEIENEESNVNPEQETTESEDCPLLKESLTTPRKPNATEDKDLENENGTEEIEMDDDFDPSLLCPDIAMEVDEAPVITTTDSVPPDGNKSPLLYDPVYSTYVDEMTGAEVTFNLTAEEHQLRHETYGEKNPVQFSRIHCTACNVHLGSALDGQTNRFVHPLLKVLICKNCYHFYTSGEFEKDEDGSELYCRWCGQGGQVMCCSSCEMVFCKKCIRINFGRKKLTEIRDSDDWMCFRCNPVQLTSLRVHCAEFMEYVRREISRAATLENATSFMTTDYTQCCLAQKKKYVDPNASEPKKRKRKIVDPNYEPEYDQPDSPNSGHSPTDMISKVVPILPKPADPSLNAGTVIHTDTQGRTMYKVGNTVFKPRVAPLSQMRPMLQTVTPGGRAQSSSSYIKIMPSGIRAIAPSPRQAQTFTTGSVRAQSSFQPRPAKTMNPTMKHEWFEKTVRAAARVNSNLSYTLTQLNRAQATATSVEALAVVHNKLQEILSTSINSLIQIRKNLRTEFIAGIKNIRFPAKPPPPRPLPSTSSQDDDVIFVSPTTSPVPPPLPLPTPNNLSPPNNIISSVVFTPTSVIKRNVVPVVPTTNLQPIPSTSTGTNDCEDKPKVFLRVKSLSALQNVPSECITIPDDPIPPSQPPPLTPIRPTEEVAVIHESPKQKEDIPTKESVPQKLEEKPNPLEDADVDMEKSCKDDESNDNSSKVSSKIFPTFLELTVRLERSAKVEELIRSRFDLVHGDTE